MNDERLRELLSALPGEEEVAFRATRARRAALKRLDDPQPRRQWLWAPAATVAVLLTVLAGVLLRHPPPVPATANPAQATVRSGRENLRMKWVLSDGTRVLWTFHRESNT